MKHACCAIVIITGLAGGRVAAHHSYAAYDMDRVSEIAGVVEEFLVQAPHSLLRVKTDDGRVYVAEWLAPRGITRMGIEAQKLKKGDRVVLTGNPHREIAANGILNFKSVTRPADGLSWAMPGRPR
jgi:hypothetical protein